MLVGEPVVATSLEMEIGFWSNFASITPPGVVYCKIVGVTRMADHLAAFRKNESAPVVLAFVEFLRARAR
jgi:hypothetical protein